MEPKITIIIPFYNVENYIEKCINSVKAQTFTDFECILIDDKSPDPSLNIALKLIKDDSRFKIIQHTENKGQGGARNTGLDSAKGEWIAFLDSDDYLEKDFLLTMYNEAIKKDIDIVICKYKSITSEGKEVGLNKSLLNGVYSNNKELLDFFLTYPTPWNKLYRKQLWDNIRFPEKLYYEDLATIFQPLLKAYKVKFIEKALVCYNLRQGSTTKHFSRRQLSDKIAIFSIIKQKLEEKGVENKDELLRFVYLLHIVYLTCCDVIQFNTEVTKKEMFKELQKTWDKKYFSPKSIWQVRKKLGFIKTFLLLNHYYSATVSCYLFTFRNSLKNR